ncbi:hypothetical protein ZHAS_00018576 [Anopheles sinensis]|uniref:Uncharacterized protein n=1 Tax=Anopheles sinensis TaxID=74873 RepID=A0A084WJZ0_ANOSI|nr:hypothetical protein ZHAS_00018576 [Anopheles sinensis]
MEMAPSTFTSPICSGYVRVRRPKPDGSAAANEREINAPSLAMATGGRWRLLPVLRGGTELEDTVVAMANPLADTSPKALHTDGFGVARSYHDSQIRSPVSGDNIVAGRTGGPPPECPEQTFATGQGCEGTEM